MIDHDPDDLEIISNSPRSGTCGYVEDPSAALRWYPPGWSADEIAPEGILEGLPNDEEAEMDAAIAAVTQDARPEIDAFVEAEEAAYGEEIASMAGDTVMAFCIFMQAHLWSSDRCMGRSIRAGMPGQRPIAEPDLPRRVARERRPDPLPVHGAHGGIRSHHKRL